MNKPKSNRKKYIVKPKVGKKLIISTVASVMAVTLTALLVWNAMKVSVPVEANTLSGVSEALKDHGSGEAFIILDIVPGTTDDPLPLGTIGYLTSGQSQLEKKLKKIFEADPEKYKSYEARENKAKELAGSYADVDYQYLESPFGGNGSWTEIYGGDIDASVDFDADSFDGYWSIVKGHVVTPAAGGPFKLVSDLPSQTMMSAFFDSSYIPSNEPLYEGYMLLGSAPVDYEDLDQYDEDTPVFVIDEEGSYIFICTIADFPAIMGEQAEKLDADKETIEKNDEEIESYKGRIAELQKQLEELKQQTPQDVNQNPETTDDEGGETGTDESDSASLNWVKFAGVGDDPEAVSVTVGGEESKPVGGEESKPEGGEESKPEGGEESKPEDGEESKPEGGGESKPEGGEESKPEGGEESKPEDGEESKPDDGEENKTETGDKPTTDDSSEELKNKLEEINNELEKLNNELKELEELQEELKNEVENGSQEEYLVAEFEHKVVKKGGEPISGLFKPDKSETVPYEKPVMMLADESADYSTYEMNVAEGNRLVYVGTGNGTCTITLDSKGNNILVYGAPVSFRCYHEDLLKEHVFEDSGLNIQINVKSAADVSIEDVRSADLIYLEDVHDREHVNYISGGNDMSEAVVYNIVDRAVNDLMPVIVDYQVSQGGITFGTGETPYNGTNFQKLASILLMTDLYSFFEDMDEKVDDMLLNATTDEYGRKSNDAMHFVNGNIYVVNSDMVTLSSRADFKIEFGNISGFEEVQSAIDMERKQGKEELLDACKAMAIQYIINYANGFIGEFRDFSILELQPTDIDIDTEDGYTDLKIRNDSRNNTILYWRKPGSSGSGQQIVRSRQLIEITVNTESVAQFVGEQSDINDKYQMVFIGLDGQKLNYEGKDTVYNDSSLNGKVYSGTGDIADGEGQRYEGIDITPQKKNALLDFMQAGYPIVLENNFFVNKSAKDAAIGDINTDYIDESSQMYEFLEIALSSEDYKWCLYTIADIHANYSDFVAQIGVHRPAIAFDWDNAASALNYSTSQQEQIIQTIAADAEGKYRGYIPYRVTDDVGDSYSGSIDTKFYLDMNQDGRFDDVDERVTSGIAFGDGLLAVEFGAPERGSIPWKLEISDSGNEYRRASITGYFHITQDTQMPVRIVQVMGDAEGWEDANCNLEAAYEMADDATTPSLLGYYLKNLEAPDMNMKFEIKSMTVSQLAAELALNSRYLAGVDVLVLGFGPECNLEVPVATANPLGDSVKDYVNNYISEGRGVLVSPTAPIGINRMQLEYGAVGLNDIRTYNRLGNDKSSVTYYKYATLKPEMFDEEWDSLSANKVNDGAVSHYPYEVDESVLLQSDIRIPDYVLNLYDNGSSDADVTAWYCLGDSTLIGDQESSYGVSPKDAANNYYLYSKGNVVYIGESKYPYTYGVGTTPTDNVAGAVSCKLFVNALMEAYNVGIKNPKVSIVAGLADGAAETDIICIPYDEQIRELEESEGAISTNGVLDDTVDVFFKMSEPNLAFEKTVTVEFYYEDNITGSQVDIGGKEVSATKFESEIWTVDQNQLVSVNAESGLDFVPDKIYKIKAPVISLKNEGDKVYANIYIVVKSSFFKLGQTREPIGSDTVILNRAQLFLLE